MVVYLIEVEWWEVYEVPATITYRNEALTGFEPELVVVSDSSEGTSEDIVGEVKVEIQASKSGEVKAAKVWGSEGSH